jgi:hypothetical protein
MKEAALKRLARTSTEPEMVNLPQKLAKGGGRFWGWALPSPVRSRLSYLLEQLLDILPIDEVIDESF